MKSIKSIVGVVVLVLSFSSVWGQQSVARQWNEVLLESIRKDLSRPTVHARNLFHISAAMYDAWAVYDPTASNYFLGKDHHGFNIPFDGIPTPPNIQIAREEAISYAAYRLLKSRFKDSPNFSISSALMDNLFLKLGYDPAFISEDYTTGSAAALGNYIAAQIIAYGLQDGSFESDLYRNQFYKPVNTPMAPKWAGNKDLSDPNRWQPLAFNSYIDQSGSVFYNIVPDFLSPEWGGVDPFSLKTKDLSVKFRDGNNYLVYHDPGPPALFDVNDAAASEDYIWSNSLVSIWSSHLDPTDGVMWDISPASIGNLNNDIFPVDFAGLRNFYNEFEGGDNSAGRSLNPVTQLPYTPQIVPRGDYTRVLAEFWADGPDSETPPGHWFSLLNYVSDHPLFTKQFEGQGALIDDLEWDVKSYFALGGAMHDAAIAAWGIKGYYDYIRPISALRYLAGLGQSSNPALPKYHPAGIKLIPGFIESVMSGDPLEGFSGQNRGKIKVLAWKGPSYIANPTIDQAGVDWILAENWWPYQRPTFVTPPFAGYVSGHSTYSRAAAELLTLLTGNEYFPGGMGEFVAKQNQFLVFEEGPSVDVVLQWATYRDASDQCSLSRIWGGIHPPVDDIPGRIIGQQIGNQAYTHAKQYFTGNIVLGLQPEKPGIFITNPAQSSAIINLEEPFVEAIIYDLQGRIYSRCVGGQPLIMPSEKGLFIVKIVTLRGDFARKIIVE